METQQDSYLFAGIFIDTRTCVRACVCVGIKPSAAPGRAAAAAPVKCQMVGVDMANSPPLPRLLPPPSSPHGSRLLHVFALLLPGLARSAHCLPRGNSPFTSAPHPTPPPPNHHPGVVMHRHSSVPGVHSVRGRPADYVRYDPPRRKYHRRKKQTNPKE